MNETEKEEYRQYLESRRSSRKINYYLASLAEIEEIRQKFSDRRPRMLLHACCAVCAGWPLEFLSEVFDITIYYNNSNIWPEAEYTRRLEELRKLLREAWGSRISLIVPPYDNKRYTKEILSSRSDDPEGWKRCFHCYETRMDEAYAYASANGYDFFTTVMTISRQKDSQKMNEIGRKLSEKYPDVAYFYSDFKKKGGQNRRDEIVKEYGLYAQDYCGCVYSYISRHPDAETIAQ